tara:strand:+ start:1788 stop:2057 length:270 start_codon:yes stop_codon:yes gene_type:complete
MSLISSVLKSLELFLQLKNNSFYYEIREKSRKRQKDIINEIEKLRSIGDSNSSDRADILRDELKVEREELEHLSAFYAKAKGKSKNRNN